MAKKIIFWLLLGVTSTVLAEVSIASSPYALFDFYGLVYVLPLYMFHILFLASLAIPKSKPVKFSSLIIAGCIFGLYEAYITKVLWNPPWDAEAWRVMDVAVMSFLMLVFFYHVWMSFLFPLLLVEHYTCGEKRVFNALPVWLQRLLRQPLFYILGAIYLGVIHGGSVQSVLQSLLSTVINLSVMVLLLMLYRKKFVNVNDTLADLLPRGTPFWIIFIGLIGIYTWHFVFSRPEAFPGWRGHVMILSAYIVMGGLLWRSLKSTQAAAVSDTSLVGEVSPMEKWWWISLLAFIISSVLSVLLLRPVQPYILISMWFFGIPIGLFMFYLALREIFSTGKRDISTTFPS